MELTLTESARYWILTLEALFFAILFLQSGLDKCLKWSENLEFHKSHFKGSPLEKQASLLLMVLTLMELATGACSAAAALLLQTSPGSRLIPLAFSTCAWVFLCLFAGQRLAKDYAGAAALVPYFLLALFGIMVAG